MKIGKHLRNLLLEQSQTCVEGTTLIYFGERYKGPKLTDKEIKDIFRKFKKAIKKYLD